MAAFEFSHGAGACTIGREAPRTSARVKTAMNMLETYNRQLFLAINAGPDTPLSVIRLTAFLADDAIFLLPVLLAGLWLWGRLPKRELVVRASCVTLLALGLNQLIILLWPHPRPFMIGLGHTWLAHAAESSFPSDHTTVFAALAVTWLMGELASLGIVILGVGLGVGWARVYLGVHFPLDIAGGLMVAGCSYALLIPAWRRFGTTLTLRVQMLYRHLFALPIGAGWLKA